MSWIPHDHPRRESLLIRERLVDGFKRGIVVPQGLIAHGRGECFDYLIGERTIEPARRAIEASAAALLLAKRPVISVNGNTAALVAKDLVRLSKELKALLEVNLFHRTRERAEKIARELLELGAERVLGVDDVVEGIPWLSSERRWVSIEGILQADIVFVALEDGDRAEALKKMGKRVIAIDLNPLSRTARAADITIVDNVVRAVPLLIEEIRRLRGKRREELEEILRNYNNEEILSQVLQHIRKRLEKISKEIFPEL
ncbi:MAG: 4-phosphopantoate--beta-alanine ligase [Desulfurococcales archaeon]|jgi:4-phosphopantoate--beta-alanine ligase|nr:4-phosphopantoate--beta-alanine ligase [Desulfurococcales archaeon]